MLVIELTARRGRGGAWADISRRLKAWHERQPATSRHQTRLSLSSGKGEGSSAASWQQIQDQGLQPGPQRVKHRGCSQLGSAERGLGRLPSPDRSHAELCRKTCRLPPGSQPQTVGSTSAGAPRFGGTRSLEDGHGWVGSQAVGLRASPIRCTAPSPARLPAPRCRSYSEIRQHFQALPCLNPAGSALVR